MDNETRDALLSRARDLEDNRDGLWTWLDDDPSVAWGDADSETYHGKLRALYLDAGWERCHHGERFHINVKLNGMGAYHEFHRLLRELEATRGDTFEYDDFQAIADQVQEWELESWWEMVTDTRDPDWSESLFEGINIYSCGRSGGYLNADDLNRSPVAMVELAAHCQGSRDYYNGADWGAYQFEMTLERYDSERLDALASPRGSAFHS